ncbi:serine--tRNA ligase, partial [Candidatus Daviesbacteria bacterium RIFCSPHIGHO2_01_FULL_38_8]
KVSGSRFYYLKNEGVLLELALLQYALKKLMAEGFSPIFPPALIKQDITQGLGYWAGGNHNNYYLVQDFEEVEKGVENPNPLYLIGTAEHALVPMHKDEVFKEEALPKKYVGFSPSFRREAGTYGKDTRGILRVHQFNKVEMVAFVRVEDDQETRKHLLNLAESFMQDLRLPYQVVQLASGDTSFPAAETIDIETWLPGQDKYRETHSISTTTDFQARRLNIKYKDQSGQMKFVYILNGTAFAIGRTLIAILENYQQEDGSVKVPEVLIPYTGFDVIKPK